MPQLRFSVAKITKSNWAIHKAQPRKLCLLTKLICFRNIFNYKVGVINIADILINLLNMITGPKQVSAKNQHFLSFIQQDSNELHVHTVTVSIYFSCGTSEASPSVSSASRAAMPTKARTRVSPDIQRSPSLMW